MNLITENTGLTIGLCITLGGAVWWAAAIQTKMDVLIGLVKDLAVRESALNKRVDKVELDVAVLQRNERNNNG